MEETFNNVFNSELDEVSNILKTENINLILENINNLSLIDLSKINPENYKNNILSEIETKFEKESNTRYYNIKKIIETIYNLSLLNLKKHFDNLIQNKIEEKIQYFISTMKSYIEKAKNDSQTEIKQSIFLKIEVLSSQQLRELNNDKYINENISIEINKFHDKTNILFHNLKDVIQTKDLYKSNVELIKNFIKINIQEKLKAKMISCPPWPINVSELLKEQNINKLNPGAKYKLYFNKVPYEVIARADGKISLPNVTAFEHYRDEELPCWRSLSGSVKDDHNTNIDNWFEPDAQFLILKTNNVYQSNWEEGGHEVFFNFFGGSKPPRPQQKKTTLTIKVKKPWSIKSFVKSGSVNVSLSNNNLDMFVSGTGGSVQNIKLELK